MLGQGLGECGGVEVRGLPGEVPQEVHLVDAAVDQHPAAVEVAAAAPVAGLERGLLVQLYHAEVADTALLDEHFTLPHRRHKARVLGDHQGDTRLLGRGDHGPAFGQGAGDGFLHEDVLARLGRQGDVGLMQVVGGTQVHGLHPGVGGGGFIGAKRPAALEQHRVRTGPRPVPAGEKEVEVVPHGLQALDKGPGELPASDDT
jgi:hypothetical protein